MVIAIEIRLLGPFRVTVDGAPVTVTSARQRALLATLALSAGRLVSIDALARCVWGEQLPARVRGSLHTYVMRLRRHIGEQAVATEPEGYRLTIERDRVDALRFLRLLDKAAGQEDPSAERAILAEALSLWNGRPLESVPSAALAEQWAPLLGERFLLAVERRIDLDTGRRDDADLAGELTELTARYPLRESLWERLIVVQARAGRSAEALATYARLRELLAEELGVEPNARLRELHLKLLGAHDERSAPAAAGQPRPRQLPFDIARFTGRQAELRELDGFLADHPGNSTAIVVIEGTAGVGKTSLAVHWAHSVQDRFPDGQLFLDMRGHSDRTPVTPDAALDTFLRAVGVPADSIPSTVEERSAMLRSRLARSAMLLLLDNAYGASQIRPLLPGSGNLVIVTSRSQLRGLVAREGAHRLTLRSFDQNDANALLAGSVGRGRLAAEPAAAAELTELCGRLPLALALAGERASRFSDMSISEVVDELRDQRLRLDALRDPQDTGTDLRAAFSWSYKALRPAAASMFRLLGLYPGLDISRTAAAAMSGRTVQEAGLLLDQLAAVHLLNQPQPDRYQFHDLLRVYAAELSEREDPETVRRGAFRRLVDWYLCVVAEATRFVRADLLTEDIVLPPMPGPEVTFADLAEAMAWYVDERSSLVALINSLANLGWVRQTWQLAWLLRGFFAQRHDRDDWMDTARLAVEMTREGDDLLAQQYAAMNLGTVYLVSSRIADGRRALEDGMRASAEMGGSTLTAGLLSNIAGAHYLLKEYEQAREYGSRALRSARAHGQTNYVAHASVNLSASCIGLGKYAEAAEHARVAHETFIEMNDRYHSALALGNLAEATEGMGDYQAAEEYGLRGLAQMRELGADYGAADVLITLGRVMSTSGRTTAARTFWREALATCRSLKDPRAAEIQALLDGLPSERAAAPAADQDAPHP
ncbi:AfsR/SARP family transcriptional regulator [Amycolatopsis anabasis]|uniref:AfsR/SARP family transcriptional regulator n=1 Tax=Amycolatopsis anabasis TaxID=1840409 RepID=UPI00131DC689|nr:BTAD domain-containing putative transcriptional regulator [Amycolatopsis anabasis]